MKRLFPSLPAPPHLGDVFRAFPETVPPLLEYHDRLLRGDSDLTVGQRELIAAYVSGLNACSFCHNGHRAFASWFGIEAGVIDAIMDDLDTAPVDDRLKPLLAYARKLTREPARMTEADAEAVYAAGWSERALFDAVQVTALFNFMNRIVEGTGVSPDAPSPVPPDPDKPRTEHTYTDFGQRMGVVPDAP